MASQLGPDGGERRVYTDERMPGIEIHNDGGPMFMVVDVQSGNPIDEFKARERIGVDAVSEPFAQRRAREYFDRMAEAEGAEVAGAGGEPEGAAQAGAEPQPVNRLQWKAKAQPPLHPKGRLGPARLGNVMVPADVDAIIARIRSERDPQAAAALKRQALSMMAQEESVAQRVVRLLLEL